MISATDSPFCCSISLLSSTKAPADLLRQHLAERRFSGAAQADQRDAAEERSRRGADALPPGENVLGLGDLRAASPCAARSRITGQSGVGSAAGMQVLEMRAHRVRETRRSSTIETLPLPLSSCAM